MKFDLQLHNNDKIKQHEALNMSKAAFSYLIFKYIINDKIKQLKL